MKSINRFKAFLAAIFLAVSLSTIVHAQTEPTWKDQGESDIGLGALNEPDPVKKLDLLKKWEQQYPETAFKAQRTFMATQALIGLITGAFGKPEGPALDAGKKAAQQLLEGAGIYFDDALRTLPQLAQTTPDAWKKIRDTSELQAHALLAYAAALKKDDSATESEYKKIITLDPTLADTSYRLGALILHEIAQSNDFTRFSEALYNLARSLAVTGPNALPPQGKAAAEKALKANYSNYHGDTEGLEDLIKQAANSAQPPPGFYIQSKVDIANEKAKNHAAWADAHPEQAFWETIQTQLESQGDAFFASLKDVGFPPPPSEAYKGGTMLKGTVVSVPNPKQILVNVNNPAGDAILKFDDNIKGEIPAGTPIQFKGVVDAWTKAPTYVLTLVIQEPKTDIAGLPDGVTFVPDAATKPKPGPKGPTKAPAKKTVK